MTEHVTPSASWDQFAAIVRNRPEISQAVSRINLLNLEAKATQLRNGIGSRVNTSVYAFGGVNIVFEIVFDDGIVWVARILQFCPEWSQNSSESAETVESEVATLRLLKAKTSIPVPAVYGYDSRYENEIGTPYILMEAMPGKRLWAGGRADFIPEKHKSKVYTQIANILIQLFSLEFPKIGMLYWDSTTDSYVLGQIVDQHSRVESYGPFNHAFDFYQTRSRLLWEYYKSTGSDQSHIDRTAFNLKCVPSILDPTIKSDAFYLTHPDFRVLRISRFTLTD
jgi:Phosphotransferase enzyme family